MRHTVRFALFFGTLAAFAQEAPLPEFEVASIKAAPAPEGQAGEMKLRAMDGMVEMMVGTIPMKGMTVTMDSRTLQQLVATAYKVRPSEVAGPGWISDLRFNVEAKLPAGADKKSANEMLQRLLAERFGLKIHRETRTSAGFVLTVGKDGAHLTPPGAPRPSAHNARSERRGRSGGRQAQDGEDDGRDETTREHARFVVAFEQRHICPDRRLCLTHDQSPGGR